MSVDFNILLNGLLKYTLVFLNNFACIFVLSLKPMYGHQYFAKCISNQSI